MPALPIYENNVYPDPAPMAELARASGQNGYYRGQMIGAGWSALGRGISGMQADIKARMKEAREEDEAADVSNLTVKMAIAQADLAVKWRDHLASADPSDPDMAKNFMNDVATPVYEGIGLEAKTKKGREYIAKSRAGAWANQYISTSADASEVNGANAVLQLEIVTNAYSDAAYYDPGNWKAQIEQAQEAITAYGEVHRLDPKTRLKLQKEVEGDIAKAAIKGMIETNPEAAREALQKGEFTGMIDGEELAELTNSADARIRSEASDAKAKETEAIKLRNDEANQAITELQATVKTDEATGAMTIPPDYFTKLDAIRDKYKDVMSPEEYRTAHSYAATELRRTTKETATSDPAVYDDFSERAKNGDLTRAEVFDARARDLLSSKDFSFFMRWTGGKEGENKELKGISDFVDDFRGYIDASATKQYKDTWGASRFTEYKSDMMDQYVKAKAAGMTDDEFKDYARKALPQYTLNPKQIKAEMRKAGNKDFKSYVPPSVEPPSFEAAKKPIGEFLRGKESTVAPITGRQSLTSLSRGQTGTDYLPTAEDEAAVHFTSADRARTPMQNAETLMGMNEVKDNATIYAYLKAGGAEIDPSITAWCAAFMNASLAKSGLPGTNKLTARSFLVYGDAVAKMDAQPGDIVVLPRGNSEWQGHVGFFKGWDKNGNVILLSGNAKNRVGVDTYPADKILGIRRPPGKQMMAAL